MVLGVAALAQPCVGAAQTDWFARYQQQAVQTLDRQPSWATPLITTSPRIEQGLRADFSRQTVPGGAITWNDGGTKGLQLIPLPRTELRLSPPPFSGTRTPRGRTALGMWRFG